MIAASCQDIESCDANDEVSYMVVDFLDHETGSPKKQGFTITSASSPYEFVPFSDSLGVALPLDPNKNSLVFFFDSLGTTVHYELEVSYEVQVSIFDEKCDPSFVFSNLDTLRYSFDSVAIPGRITNRQIETNVQVYF